MKLFLAAVYTAGFHLNSTHAKRATESEMFHRKNIRYYLESYHYVHSKAQVDKLRTDGMKVFLDSGAFSAYSQGVEIDIDKYCDYIKTNSDIIDVASVLDGIGDPQKTFDNQVYMESQGTRPLPCFHYGEDERYLEHYIENYEYITLGGMVPISTPQLFFWLDRIWDKYLTNPDGTAKIKVHGFGLTSAPLMKRYPWYSVDSSSWVQMARTGNLYMQEYGTLAISNDSPSIKMQGQHASHLPEPQRLALLAEFEKRGFEWDRLASDYVSRFAFNMCTFRELNDEMNKSSLHYKDDQIRLF